MAGMQLRETFTRSLRGGRVDEGSVQLECMRTCIPIPYIEPEQLFTVKTSGFTLLGAQLFAFLHSSDIFICAFFFTYSRPNVCL